MTTPTTPPMPECEIKLGARSSGIGTITYIWKGYAPLTIMPYHGNWPQPEEILELWAVANDPNEPEPLRLVKDNVDG